jgi:S1-C subfamily serine protease
MKKLLFSLLVVAFIFLGTQVSAFDKTAGKLDFPESGYSEAIAQSHVTISTRGTGYGLLPVWNEKAQRTDFEWALGNYGMEGSGFVVRGGYVITAAHVVDPTMTVIQTGSAVYYAVRMYQMRTREIQVSTWDSPGPPLEVVYVNIEQDVAVLKFVHPRIPFKESPIEVALTRHLIPRGFFGWMVVDSIEPGDMICTIVSKRTEDGEKDWLFEARFGKVRSPRPAVPEGYESYLPFLSMTDFTMDLEVIPGDSGSPVIAFLSGKPVIIGIARAGIGTSEHWTYAARIDIIYPLLWAVK